ncbi:MAG TPA: hypothetical protein VHV08_01905, partial [Pirellulales bacterium]|nr:hypothetical protein [Pirellulales bacterium]
AATLTREISASTGRIRSLAYLSGGDKVVSAGDGRTISIWHTATGQESYRFVCPTGKVLCLAVCGEKLIATGGSDNLVRVWNWETQTEVDRLVGHTGSVATLAYDPSSEAVISGSFDTTVRVWRLNASSSVPHGPGATRHGAPVR